jgi:Tfp pilus assembly protein PilO
MELNPAVQAKIDQLSKLPPAARAGLLAGIAVLICAGYWGAIYRDADAKLERLRGQEFELQRKLSEVRSIAANIAEFEEEIKNLELRLAKVLRQLPNDKELEVLLTDISNLAKKAGVEIKSFHTGSTRRSRSRWSSRASTTKWGCSSTCSRSFRAS